MKKGKEKHIHDESVNCSTCGIDHHNHSLKSSLILYFSGLVFFILALFIENNTIKMIFNLLTLILSGYHIIVSGFKATYKESIRRKKLIPNVHVLMTLAAIGAMIIGEYFEGSMLILIFAGAHFLEDYANNKSQVEISKLLKLNPTEARLILNDNTTKLVDVSTLKVGDKLQVLHGDQVPTDGIILNGNPSIDESSITGESMPAEKGENDLVFGSTINLVNDFTMEVTKTSDETVIAKIIALVSQTKNNISKTAAIIKRVEPIYVNIVLLITPIFYFIGMYLLNWGHDVSIYRTMVFLIVTSPCALAATDIPASLSAISNLAKNGILFKGSSYLSNIASTKVVAFDKTGTITTGKPVITDSIFFTDNQSKVKLYKELIHSMESKSNHPLAKAITNYFKDISIININADQLIGTGIETKYNNVHYKIAKASSFEDVNSEIIKLTETLELEGKTVMYFSDNNIVVGLLAALDIENKNVKSVINYLNKSNIHSVMITGDAKLSGEAIAKRIGITEARTNVLPEDKASIINELKLKYGLTVMIGDGVNDAPALVSADIGLAMGDGTDIAIDIADGVLMKNDLSKFEYVHKVSKKLRIIIIQNILFSLSVILSLIVLNLFGLMNMPYAVLIHEGSTIVVILNGLRMLFYKPM